MEALAALLLLIGMVTGTLSFIGLLRPSSRLYLPSKKRAALVWAVLLAVFGSLVTLEAGKFYFPHYGEGNGLSTLSLLSKLAEIRSSTP